MIHELIERRNRAEAVFNLADANQHELIDYAIYELMAVEKEMEMLRRG